MRLLALDDGPRSSLLARQHSEHDEHGEALHRG